MKNVTTFENAQVGDKVYSIINGHGKIVSVAPASMYPISVEFESKIHRPTYTFQGIHYIESDIYPTLFWDVPTEIKDGVIVPPPKPRWRAKDTFL